MHLLKIIALYLEKRKIYCIWSFSTTEFPTWGYAKGTENPQAIWLWSSVGFDYRIYTRLRKQTLRRQKQNLAHARTQEKGAVAPQKTDPDVPVSVQESLTEVWVDSGLLQGQGDWIPQCLHKTFWRRSPLSSLPPPLFGLRSNNREGTQPRASAESWIKDLLNMAPPIRTRPIFLQCQSLLSWSFHKSLPFIHHSADRMKTTNTGN